MVHIRGTDLMMSTNLALQQSKWNMLVAWGPHHQMHILSLELRLSQEYTRGSVSASGIFFYLKSYLTMGACPASCLD